MTEPEHSMHGPRLCGTPPLRILGCLAALVLLAGACGNLTSGGFGEVEVVLTSQALDEVENTVAHALGPAFASDAGGAHPVTPNLLSPAPPGLEGTLVVRLRSFALNGAGERVELTDGLQEVTLSLRDPAPVELARRDLPDGEYRGIRTVLERIEAQVVRGLDVGGSPVTGTIVVEMGPSGALEILTEAPFRVRSGEGTQVALEMRSEVWLRLADAARRRVPGDVFREIFRVRVGGRGLGRGSAPR